LRHKAQLFLKGSGKRYRRPWLAKVPENDQIGITDSRPKRSRFMMRLLYDLWVQKQENPTEMGQAFRKGVVIKLNYGI
jgi:hypothetical protein